MNDLTPRVVPAMTARAVADVRRLEFLAAQRPQVEMETTHQFHAGIYSRTLKVPAGVLITGALIKIPTTLVVSGHAVMYGEGGAVELRGYHVMAAAAHRKQAFLAMSDTWITMLFTTAATTVEDAEAEFTDEADMLMTRREDV